LHERFADALTIIGVHAGKYPAERHTERIAAACDRLGVEHPVVNDRQFRVWKQYAVSAWPTVAIVDADGRLLGVQPGEFDVEDMAGLIGSAIAKAEQSGSLVRGPDPIAGPRSHREGFLRFPGRVALAAPGADADTTARLLVADTGHGRVLDCELDTSTATATVLSEHTGFTEPQGMLVMGDSVYVADRAGHAVWRLSGGERQRVAGTGVIGDYGLRAGNGPETAIRSPWGLAPFGGRVIITMAGAHQLWALDPASLRLEPWAGTGREDIADGPRAAALLAQPTGACSAEDGIAFADSESSAIRLADESRVHTVVGTGLFDFGDKDGVGDSVRLQHAEDVACLGQDRLAVADTYNDRLKIVRPSTRQSTRWPGAAGEPGALREPTGIASDGKLVVVADTGNHRVVLVDEDGGIKEVRFE
jgi:hypothetical protein